MICADDRTRLCYNIMCGTIADYQEQVLITSVRNNVVIRARRAPTRSLTLSNTAVGNKKWSVSATVNSM